MKKIHYNRTLNTVRTNPHTMWGFTLLLVLVLAFIGMCFSYKYGREDTEWSVARRLERKLNVPCLNSEPKFEWVKDEAERERTKTLLPYERVSDGLWCYNSDTNRVKWLTEINNLTQKEYERLVKDLTRQIQQLHRQGGV